MPVTTFVSSQKCPFAFSTRGTKEMAKHFLRIHAFTSSRIKNHTLFTNIQQKNQVTTILITVL